MAGWQRPNSRPLRAETIFRFAVILAGLCQATPLAAQSPKTNAAYPKEAYAATVAAARQAGKSHKESSLYGEFWATSKTYSGRGFRNSWVLRDVDGSFSEVYTNSDPPRSGELMVLKGIMTTDKGESDHPIYLSTYQARWQRPVLSSTPTPSAIPTPKAVEPTPTPSATPSPMTLAAAGIAGTSILIFIVALTAGRKKPARRSETGSRPTPLTPPQQPRNRTMTLDDPAFGGGTMGSGSSTAQSHSTGPIIPAGFGTAANMASTGPTETPSPAGTTGGSKTVYLGPTVPPAQPSGIPSGLVGPGAHAPTLSVLTPWFEVLSGGTEDRGVQKKLFALGGNFEFEIARADDARNTANYIPIRSQAVSRSGQGKVVYDPTTRGCVVVNEADPAQGRNPISVNTYPLAAGQSQKLEDGDTIQIGDVQLRYHQS